MKSLQVFLLCFCLLISAVGCQNKENVQQPSKDTKNSQENSQENNQETTSKNENVKPERPTYESMFVPPNFLVTNFDVSYKEQKITFIMNYEFDESLYNELKKNNTRYSFIIDYPDEITDIIDKDNSDVIKAPEIDNAGSGTLNYQVKYNYEVTKKLTEEQVNKIVNSMSYGLLILNSEGKIFSIFNDVRYLKDYKKGTSQSTILPPVK